MKYLKIYDQEYINSLTRKRTGETKLGECVQVVNSFVELISSSAKYVMIGLPEDIGVRANFGRGGTDTAWLPAVNNILNIQSNEYFTGNELIVLGQVDFDDLVKTAAGLDIKTSDGIIDMRALVSEIDARVSEIIKEIVKAGKIPIIIGGGHNNAYGNIKGTAQGLFEAGKIKSAKINCINSDAHTDFRALEGRHSGNGFSYAFSEGYLNKYSIIGLHESYNSQNVFTELKKYPDRISYSTFENIFIREELNFKEAVAEAIDFAKDDHFGIELDMDTVQNIPSSAKTSSGISPNQARQYVTWAAQNVNSAYLHISEAAPVLSHIKTDNKTGKLIAYLVADFIKANKSLIK